MVKKTSKKVCLVATLLNEEKFLDEWLIYHKMLGISHFFLYDDDPNLPLYDCLHSHRDYITVIPWKGVEKSNKNTNNQVMAYRHAWKHYLHIYEWVVFLDGDEFIVLRQHENLNEFLSGFDQSAIALTWHVFGHNGYYEDPDDLVIESLTRRKKLPINNFKSFTRVSAIQDINNMHTCQLRHGIMVDANNGPFKKQHYPGKTDVANINHYQTRSFKNWMKRAERGVSHFITGDCPPEQIWRTSPESCLKHFVVTVAYDRNEYIDEYMLKYCPSVRKGIYLLNKNKSFLEGAFSFSPNLIHDLKSLLNEIANTILSNSNIIMETNIGLTDGSVSLPLFLFNYGRFINDPKFEEIASAFLEKLFDQIEKSSAIECLNQLTAFGSVMESLAQNYLVDIDTDDILNDIDILVTYILQTGTHSSKKAAEYDIVGIGNYCIYRLKNKLSIMSKAKKNNLEHLLSKIIGLTNFKLGDIYTISRFIIFMADAYVYLENDLKIKAKKKCDAALDYLKLTITDDEHMVDDINMAKIIAILFNASKKLDDNSYYQLANKFLNNNDNPTDNLKKTYTADSGVLAWLNCCNLNQISPSVRNTKNALLYLEQSILEVKKEYLKARNELNFETISLVSRFGTSLLYALDNRVDCAPLYN